MQIGFEGRKIRDTDTVLIASNRLHLHGETETSGILDRAFSLQCEGDYLTRLPLFVGENVGTAAAQVGDLALAWGVPIPGDGNEGR